MHKLDACVEAVADWGVVVDPVDFGVWHGYSYHFIEEDDLDKSFAEDVIVQSIVDSHTGFNEQGKDIGHETLHSISTMR